MAGTAPEHLNEEFFRDALANAAGSEVQIKELHVKQEQITGGYCSDIYRVKVRYSAKQAADNGTPAEREEQLLVKELFESLADNSREHLMYAKVLPEFHAILAAAGIKTQLSPKTYMTRKVKREMHVFEDLSAKGYEILDRLVGYNAQQIKGIFKKLGQFHAASMVYKEKHPDVVASMKGFFCLSDANLMAFTQKQIDDNTNYVVKIVETWPGYKHIAEKMRQNMGENFKRKFFHTLDKERSKVRVIIHGDVWIRNILMLDTAEGSDVILLDYQNSCESSAALDVLNVFMTSANYDVLKNHRPELIEYYHSVFADTLKAIKYPAHLIPTLQNILDEIKRIEYYNYYVLIFPFAQTNLSYKLADSMDFNAFGDEKRLECNRQDIYSNPRVLDTYKLELKRLDELGVLD